MESGAFALLSSLLFTDQIEHGWSRGLDADTTAFFQIQVAGRMTLSGVALQRETVITVTDVDDDVFLNYKDYLHPRASRQVLRRASSARRGQFFRTLISRLPGKTTES